MSRNEVELDFKFDIEKVLKHAKEAGFEIVEKTEENEQGGLFYKDENGELVKWDVMKEMFALRDHELDTEESTITITVSEWNRLREKEEESNRANNLLEYIYRYGVGNQEVEQMEEHFFKFDYKFTV